MGSLGVKVVKTRQELNKFTKALLNNIQLLDRMIEEEWFDVDQMHIGAEQEFCLIDPHYKPASKSLEILEKINDPAFTTELALFNIEANLQPQPFKGSCFSDMASELNGLFKKLDHACDELNIHYLLSLIHI